MCLLGCHMGCKRVGCRASMTHMSHIMRFAKFRIAENQATLEAEFVSIWCTIEVFCKVTSLTPMKVNPLPPFTHHGNLCTQEPVRWVVCFGFINSCQIFSKIK